MNPHSSEQPVDEFDLEVELGGGEVDPERSARLRADTSLDPARAEIEHLRMWWLRNAPGLPVRSPRRSRFWLALPVALAAGVAFVLLNNTPSPEYTSRGSLSVDVQAIRGGLTIDRAEGLTGGDELVVQLVPERDVYVTMGTVQDDGGVSLLVVGTPAGPQHPFRPTTRALMDDYPGREWLVVWLSPHPPPDDAVLVDVHRALLPDPGAAAGRRDDLVAIEITRQPGRP